MPLDRLPGSHSRDIPRVAPGTSRADSAGDPAVAIAEQITQVYLTSFGRGPGHVRAYIQPKFAVCVLRDILTTGERSLLERGGLAEVESARDKVNEGLDRRLISIVEMQTGRLVLSHLARVRAANDVAVHFFLFDDVSVPRDAVDE